MCDKPTTIYPAIPLLRMPGTRLKQKSMNEELRTIEDLQLAEIAEQEMEIMIYSIPDSRSFEVLNEVLRRFREKLTH